jgi:transcription termination/antitermination protein NusA
MSTEFIQALDQIEEEKGISKEVLLDAIEAALISAYRRNFGSAQNVSVDIDRETGVIHVYARKTVVSEVMDPRLEISLDEAREISPKYQADDIVELEVTPRNFGRIAAQTAKQVVVQRIREAERGIVYEEYAGRENDIVTGIVQRFEHKNVFVDLGKTEAVLTPQEQSPSETYKQGERIKTYVVEVKKTTKGPQIVVSRTHPGLLKRLFELEVPEIHDGVVEIKAIAREAGHRSKVAVASDDENVDAIGACVGPKGVRVQTIVSELRGEKIDIVEWSADPAEFVANALSPAKVVSVTVDPEHKIARVVVPDYQLSLAIGKEGQNARLAAKLTNWKIDIKSESQVEPKKTTAIEPAVTGEDAADPASQELAKTEEQA